MYDAQMTAATRPAQYGDNMATIFCIASLWGVEVSSLIP
jgi:hypothetical protein